MGSHWLVVWDPCVHKLPVVAATHTATHAATHTATHQVLQRISFFRLQLRMPWRRGLHLSRTWHVQWAVRHDSYTFIHTCDVTHTSVTNVAYAMSSKTWRIRIHIWMWRDSYICHERGLSNEQYDVTHTDSSIHECDVTHISVANVAYAVSSKTWLLHMHTWMWLIYLSRTWHMSWVVGRDSYIFIHECDVTHLSVTNVSYAMSSKIWVHIHTYMWRDSSICHEGGVCSEQ